MSQNLNCCLPLPSPVAKWCRRYCNFCCWPCPPPILKPSTWNWPSCCPCRPRIHPATPNKVVVRRLSSSGGVTNLSFQADDPQDQMTFNNSLESEQTSTATEVEVGGVEPTSQKEWPYKRHANVLYLKTGQAKCIHVIHVKVKPPSRLSASDSTKANTNGDTDGVTTESIPAPPNGNCSSKAITEFEEKNEDREDRDREEEDDDEDYWFSKWSNRPKLRPPPLCTQPQSHAHRLSAPPTPTAVPDSKCASFTFVSPEEVHIEISTTDPDGITNPAFQGIQEEQEHGVRQNGMGDGDRDVDGMSQCSTTLSMESTASSSDRQFPVPDEIITIRRTSGNSSPTLKPYNMYKRRPSPAEALEKTGVLLAAALAAVDKSPPKPPLIFFVHGISGSSDVWTSQIDFFHERGFEVVAIDLLGHGLSSAPPKSKFYTFESLVQDLVYVYDYFVPSPSSSNANENGNDDEVQVRPAPKPRATVLVGHGYGCCLTSVLSRLRPNHISALVSIAGGGPTPLAPEGTLRPPTLLPFQISNIFVKRRTSARFDPVDLRHVLPPPIRQYIIDGQVWLECDSAFHHRIQVPTLLVYGLRDTTVTLVEECEMEKAMPKAFLELLPAAGHFPMLDEPRKLNRMMEKFLQAWLPVSPAQ